MSGEALGWAKKQVAGGRGPKDVLKTLADYADQHGFAYPSIARLATECEASERTVQRDLRHLEDMGLLQGFEVTDARTGRSRTRLYWFPMEGDEPSSKMKKAIEAERGARVTWVSPSQGDMGVTGEGDMGVTPGVTTVSPHMNPLLEPSEADASSAGAGASVEEIAEELWSSWPAAGRAHSSERLVVEAVTAEAKAGADLAEVRRGGLAYCARPSGWGASGDKPKSPHRFIAEGRWKTHADAVRAKAAATRNRFADEGLRKVLVGLRSEGWAVSWLDPCPFDAGKREIDPRLRSRAEKLREPDVAQALKAMGVMVLQVGS